ncbi:MAG: SurA N-terminal domain-containing protein, partial [Elusimicrobia bacterium]|nr:SurA N-terminal domain-containing protein [Elusimicrobiota bacterium]
IRKNAKEILIAIAVVFIAGIFFMSYQPKMRNVVLKINNKKISYTEFTSAYSRALNERRDNSEQDLTETQMQRLKNSVLSGMAQDELVLQQAQKLKVKCPDALVGAAIMSMKSFQKDGRFDPRLYEAALRIYYKMPRYEFEENVRKSIKRQFLRNIVLSSAKITPFEVEFLKKLKKFKAKDEKEQQDFELNLLNEKRNLFYYGWLSELFNNAKIENYLPKIEKAQR